MKTISVENYDDAALDETLEMDADLIDLEFERRGRIRDSVTSVPAPFRPSSIDRLELRPLEMTLQRARPEIRWLDARLHDQHAAELGERILSHERLAPLVPQLGVSSGRGSLAQTARPTGPVVLGVTSAVDGEGKTTVALQIALSVARNSFRRVCLVDFGLCDNAVFRRLGLDASDVPGLSAVLQPCSPDTSPRSPLTLPLYEMESLYGLVVAPGGAPPERPLKAVHSPHVPVIFNALRERFDLVIVDMPSVAGGNALPLVPFLNGVVLAVRAGVTPRDAVDAAVARLGRGSVCGLVLNGRESPLPRWIDRRLTAA